MTDPQTTPAVVLAVDGNSLAHRAYHAYGPRDGKDPLTSSDGSPRWATYGFLRLLTKIAEMANPDGIIVAFDDPTGSKRKEWDPNYKANRSEKDQDLYTQMRDIAKVLSELGIMVAVSHGWEADDVVGSAAHVAETLGSRCVIATSDRDAFQLISEQTTVLRILNGMQNSVMMTPERLVEDYNVRPEQYLDYSAMRGDKSDNLDGVPGIAEKTAAKILAWGSVRDVLDDPAAAREAIGKGPVDKLVAGTSAWEHNVKMMCANRELKVPVERCSIGHRDKADVKDVLLRWEIPSMVRPMQKLLCEAPSAPDRFEPAAEVEAPTAVAVPDTPAGLFDMAETVETPREPAVLASASSTTVSNHTSIDRPPYPGADWPLTLI